MILLDGSHGATVVGAVHESRPGCRTCTGLKLRLDHHFNHTAPSYESNAIYHRASRCSFSFILTALPQTSSNRRTIPARVLTELRGNVGNPRIFPTSFLPKKSFKNRPSFLSWSSEFHLLTVFYSSTGFLRHTFPSWLTTATPRARRQMSRMKTSLLWNTSMRKRISRLVSFTSIVNMAS